MAAVLTRTVEYRVLEALGENCGVIVADPETGECAFRFRTDFDEWAGEEAGVLSELIGQLPALQQEMGTRAFLQWMDETLSNTLRVSAPAQAIAIDLERTAQALYRRHVRTHVRPYETHLPLIPIELAAGGFGRDKARGAEEWVEARVPGRRRLSDDLFLVRVQGRSMEPDIPDGSICVFRSYYGGSRRNGIYIVQRIATLDEGGEFTLKRYSSGKEIRGDQWRHTRITMRPENPEYEDWDLREDERYVTIAEFVCVLEDPVPGEPARSGG
ncbi:MAG: S24 family peptidase [Bryobacteraceae bacterium]|nr:S24 family peptidase [Bryobacteraceae bacterium]